jgi:hypothetical protein
MWLAQLVMGLVGLVHDALFSHRRSRPPRSHSLSHWQFRRAFLPSLTNRGTMFASLLLVLAVADQLQWRSAAAAAVW